MLASYLESSACDQLEFISHVQTSAFFSSGTANDKSFTATSPACRGESDTTKADLERSRLSNIWFISTVCDPHVNRGVFEDNRSYLLQIVKCLWEQNTASHPGKHLVAVQKNPYMHIYLKADISVVFSLVLAQLIQKHFDNLTKGEMYRRRWLSALWWMFVMFLKGDKENMQSV